MTTVMNDRRPVGKALELGFQKAAVGDRQLSLQCGYTIFSIAGLNHSVGSPKTAFNRHFCALSYRR
jgi:hypothetical protein